MFKLVVLSVVLAAVSANPNGVWGAGLATPWGAPVTAGRATPLASPIFTPLFAPGPVAPIGTPNYRGPLSLAPGQPANILAADGRPLDTLSVNLDRAVHYTAKAIDNGRRLQKRSVIAANLAAAHSAARNVAAANAAAANVAAYNLDAANLAAQNVAAANLVGARLAAGFLAAGPLAGGPLAATPLAATPLTAGRSWVGPASYAIPAAAPIAPLELGVAASVGNIW